MAAERALRSRFSASAVHPLDRAGRARTIDEAFLSTVGKPERDAAILDVEQGDGGELAQPSDPSLHPRFHSARSSCALAVNLFGPWRLDPFIARDLRIERVQVAEVRAPVPNPRRPA
jgi:hypothetical protein